MNSMDTLNKATAPRFKFWQRITSFITLFFFLFQITGTAIASTLSAADIKLDLDSALEFERGNNGQSAQYEAVSEILDEGQIGYYTIEDFFERLKDQYVDAIGEPTFVPISVGDITTIIPVHLQTKSVGTPFVQSRYVRNQIRDLLGRHLIDSGETGVYDTEANQLNTLYENAFNYAVDNNKKFGESLAPLSREDSLQPNMVWPERHIINGEEVIVPIVYLNFDTIDARKVDGHTVEFNGEVTFGEIVAEGVDIKVGREGFLRTVNDLTLIESNVASDSDLKIFAGGTLELLSSQVNAGGDLVIGAHSLQGKTIVHRYDLGHEHGTRFGELTEVTASGDITVRSYSDIVLQGVDFIAGGGINFGAEGNIYLGALKDTSGEDLSGKWKGQKSSVEYLQTHLTAEESISLMAGGQIVIDAAEIVSSNGHIEILAGMGITIEDELGQYSRTAYGRFGKKKVDESVYQTVAIRSILDAGKGVKLHSDFGDITLKAVDIATTEGTQVKASNGAVNLLMTKETDHYTYSSVKKGLFTTTTKDKGHTIDTPVYNTIVGGFSVEALKGVNVEYEGLKGLDCQDYLDETGVDAQEFEDLDGNLQVEDPCLRANVHKISQMAGMEWMALALAEIGANDANKAKYHWSEVALQHKTWSESNTSLSPAFMAVVAIAVAVASGGAGSFVAGLLTGASEAALAAGTAGFLATAVSAGTVGLISQATVALANGVVNDDIGGAMEDFASEDTLKSLAISMVTAGAIAELDSAFFDLDTESIKDITDVAEAAGKTPQQIEAAINAARAAAPQSLASQIGQAVTHSTVKSIVNFTINGGNSDDLESVFITSLGSSIVSTFGESGANSIAGADLDTLSKYLAHMALGCGMGAFTEAVNSGDDDNIGSSCASGAGGAFVGELAGEIYKDLVPVDFSELDQWRADGASFAEILAIMTVDLAGGDYQIAGLTGRNAAENNALSAVEAMRHVKATLVCSLGPNPAQCMTTAATDAIEEYKANDKAIGDGFVKGIEQQLDDLENLPEKVGELVSLVSQGEFGALLKIVQDNIEAMPAEIALLVDSAFKYIVTADSEEDYIQVGETMSSITVGLIQAGLTGGASIALKETIFGRGDRSPDSLDNDKLEDYQSNHSEGNPNDIFSRRERSFDSIDDLNSAANDLPENRANSTFTHDKFEWQTDELGRVVSAQGEVDLKPYGRGNQSLQTQIGREGQDLDVGFHLMSDAINAPINRLNVVQGNGKPLKDGDVTVEKNINQGRYKSEFENVYQAEAANLDNRVVINIEPVYDFGNTTLRPDRFDTKITVFDRQTDELVKMPEYNTFENRAGG